MFFKLKTLCKAVTVLVIVAFMVTGCEKKKSGIVLEPVGGSAAKTSVSGVSAALGNTSQNSSQNSSQNLVSDSADMYSSGYADEKMDNSNNICVYVCGAVNSEGVYELPEDSRVFDAVEAAGGFRNDADISYCNQAAKLTDGIKLTIPGKSAVAVTGSSADSAEGASVEIISSGITPQDNAESQNAPININTATIQQLCNIPGIGEGRAKDILKYRDEHGGFKKKEDIMNVTGIKEKMFEKIKEQITV